jgi:hypothetical protein
MNSIRKRPVIIGAAVGAAGLAALLVTLSLSNGTNPAVATTTTSSPATVRAWHNLAQCFRSHGYTIADPTVNADGTSSWTASSAAPPPRELRNAERAVGERTCAAAYRALPPQVLHRAPTPDELHRLVLFARCLRGQGLADWPDPNSRGAFPLTARLLALGKRGLDKEMHVCGHLNPGGGITIAEGSG